MNWKIWPSKFNFIIINKDDEVFKKTLQHNVVLNVSDLLLHILSEMLRLVLNSMFL